MADLSIQSTQGENLWDKLDRPKFIVGPMVDQSELPFRLLCRKYGAHLCYTPMLHAAIFVKDPKYRKENLVPCDQDRPLIVQFCANDPETFLQAARLATPFCDAIDLNLGCPQTIAKRGHYGAFLEDEWTLLHAMVRKVSSELSIPVTCKIRIFPDVKKSIRYAQMLVSAGCQLLTVHGRTKEQKGVLTGLADWEQIKEIKNSISIPVFANGNIQSLEDVFNCLRTTGVEGVMSAEGVLHNPAVFQGVHPHIWIVAEEYLTFVKQYPCALSIIRGHLFKFYHITLTLEENFDLRRLLAKANTMKHFFDFAELMKMRCIIRDDLEPWPITTYPIPTYLCQPHFRSLAVKISIESTNPTPSKRRLQGQELDPVLSSRATKRLNVAKNKLEGIVKIAGRRLPLCSSCPNPKGGRCDFDLCRACCRNRAFERVLDCLGHKFLFKSKQNKNAIELNPQCQVAKDSLLSILTNVQE
ncbi:dihydrouridine synthase 1 [Brevipalpus obovatus]|uniref:dihydrouridine synthase 1 n=1 Tax=Brevipalpus obovatus TaxID=246614 RepID=UPI003D9E8210